MCTALAGIITEGVARATGYLNKDRPSVRVSATDRRVKGGHRCPAPTPVCRKNLA